jgi:elongation factor G
MGAGDNYRGQIDLIRRKAYFYDSTEVATDIRIEDIPEQYADEAELARQEMIEKIAEFEDSPLMEKYLADEGENISEADIIAAVRAGCLAGKLHPVLCGSALKHMGVRPLLDAVTSYLPSPSEVSDIVGHESLKSDKQVIRKSDPSEPFSGLVFKVISDSHGDLNFLRIYSGTLKAGTRVLNSTQDKKENLSRIWEMHAKQRNPRDKATAGDIVAVVGLRSSLTGDTLCDPKAPIVLERLDFPEPVISMSIEPRTNADKQVLINALNTLRREDPSFQYNHDTESGQTIISGMGELHLEVIKHKMVRDLGLEIRVGKPRVSYKETILGSAEAEGQFIRQIGGRGQYAVVTLRVEAFTPAGEEDPVVFVDETKGGVISGHYIPFVREGVMDAVTSGCLAGYPMLNVKVTLLDGKEHPVDSSELAFEQAGVMAFNAAIERAKPVFLEPIMKLTVTTPDEYFGAVTGDLAARRAIITNQEMRGKYRVLTAEVPLGEMFGYTTQVRSLSQGRASATMEPYSYAPAPAQVAEHLLRYV